MSEYGASDTVLQISWIGKDGQIHVFEGRQTKEFILGPLQDGHRELHLSCIGRMKRDGAETPKLISDIEEYIDKHLDKPLTIQKISREFAVSETALKTEFKKCCGMPIHQYVKKQRMLLAGQLLRTTSCSILEIVHRTGYKSVGQFHAAFKEQYGQTPLQYRKMSEWEEF